MRRWMTVIGVTAALAASFTLSAFAASFDTAATPRDTDLPRIVAAQVGGSAASGASATSTIKASAAGPSQHVDTSTPSVGKNSSGAAASSGGTSGSTSGSGASTSNSPDGDNDADDPGSASAPSHSDDHEVVAPPVHDSDEKDTRGSHD
ncbi:MAG TPA: hypothetical protein VIK38_02755 [Coriobacteriia bacterium]